MRFKRFPIVFAFILAFSTFFSSLAFAENNVKPNLVSLGDSITYGWNLDADHTKPSTLAFPYLIGGGKYNVSQNISFPGWTSQELLDAIQLPASLAAIQNANVITLDIGNNDLLQTPEVVQIINNPTVPPTPEQITAATQAIFGPGGTAQKLGINLTTILGKILEVNPDATIILYNMYNPFGASTPGLHAVGEQIIPQINEKVIGLLALQTGSYVADAYTAFNGLQSDYILPADIHPNTTGQQVLAGLADKILALLEPLTLDVTPSSSVPTKGPVSINVATNAQDIAKLQWLPGERTENDFYVNQGGTDITDNKFEVTENGKYTVYIMDRLERSVLKVIEINNITKDTTNPGDDGNNNPTPTPGDTGNDKPAPTPAPSTNTGGTGNPLPDTATAMFNYLAIGLILVLAGAATMKIGQSRRRENL
ncbi:MAG TPA: GDSL-type esterase/lipase family protein [Neobacillus sp.]